MMDVMAIVREYFPDATTAEAEYILWEQTGYPGFYEDLSKPEECLRKQLQEFKDSVRP